MVVIGVIHLYLVLVTFGFPLSTSVGPGRVVSIGVIRVRVRVFFLLVNAVLVDEILLLLRVILFIVPVQVFVVHVLLDVYLMVVSKIRQPVRLMMVVLIVILVQSMMIVLGIMFLDVALDFGRATFENKLLTRSGYYTRRGGLARDDDIGITDERGQAKIVEIGLDRQQISELLLGIFFIVGTLILPLLFDLSQLLVLPDRFSGRTGGPEQIVGTTPGMTLGTALKLQGAEEKVGVEDLRVGGWDVGRRGVVAPAVGSTVADIVLEAVDRLVTLVAKVRVVIVVVVFHLASVTHK